MGGGGLPPKSSAPTGYPPRDKIRSSTKIGRPTILEVGALHLGHRERRPPRAPRQLGSRAFEQGAYTANIRRTK